MPFTSPAKRPLMLLPAALLASTLLLTGCDDAARANQQVSKDLQAALLDLASVGTSHLVSSETPPKVAYNAPTATKDLDRSLLASRQDQYAVLAKRFQALTTNPAATPEQQGLAWMALYEIEHNQARYLLRRADLDRTSSLRMIAALHSKLGALELQAITKAPPQSENIVALLKDGSANGVKATSIKELADAYTEASEAYDKLKAQIEDLTTKRAQARTEIDALFAKASDLKAAVLRVPKADRFDAMDKASVARKEAEIADSGILTQDQLLDMLTREQQLLATRKVTLEQAILLSKAKLEAAEKNLDDTRTSSAQNDMAIAKLHDQWLADAKAQDELFNNKVLVPLTQALAAVETAKASLDKAEKTGNVGNLALDHAYLATTGAQIHTLQLRALAAHAHALGNLVAREKIWAPEADNGVIAARTEALAKDTAQAAKNAAESCSAALTTIGDQETLKGLKTNVTAYQKAVGEITRSLNGEAPPEPAKPEEKTGKAAS